MRIQLSKLRRLIREVMAMEPPEGYVTYVVDAGRSINIKLKTKDKVSVNLQFPEGRFKQAGEINIVSGIYVDDGLVWEVESIVTDSGYGPLLYDIAMETVYKKNDAGLIPDRVGVTSEARNVWQRYFSDRSDVGHRLLPEDIFPSDKKYGASREYMKYYYFKRSSDIIDSLKNKELLVMASE